MENIRILDDTDGRVEEAMIFYNPLTSLAIEELIAALPDVKIYVPFGYTRENLEELLKNIHKNMGTESIKIMPKFLELASNHLPFLAIFNSNEHSVRDQLKRLKIDSRRKRKSPPFNYEDISEIYSRYKIDQHFREFVYLFMSFINARHPKVKGSYQDITALKEKYGDRLEIFPTNDIIGAFPRDMIIAGDNGEKLLIQGKPNSRNPLAYNVRTAIGDARVAENKFWKGKYNILSSSEVNLALYEGGDLRATKDTLFVGQDTWITNLQEGYTQSQIEEELLRISGKNRVIVVGKNTRPFFFTHLDMYFTPFNDKAVGIGDATPVFKSLESNGKLKPIHIKAYREKQPYLDNISKSFKEMGFEVERLPLYLEFDPKSYDEKNVKMSLRSFANDVRNGDESIVATFGVPALDDIGYKVFERYGLKVKGISSAGSLDAFLRGDQIYDSFSDAGARCLINVLSRKEQ